MPKRLWSCVSQRMSDCVGIGAGWDEIEPFVFGVAVVVVMVAPDFSSMISVSESAEFGVEFRLERFDNDEDDDDGDGDTVRGSTETTLGFNFPSR